MTQVSVILPTYNERINLPIIISQIESTLADHKFEIAVIDDNSPDGTWELGRELALTRPYLKVVRRLHARGLSSAVMDGFAVAQGKYLVVMDADLQHDVTVLKDFVTAFESGADLVVGSRKVAGGSVENWSVIRKFVSFSATQMANIALSRTISDPMSGFFGISRTLFETYGKEINPRGFKILLEFLARAKKAKIVEIGYTFRGRIHGESKLSTGVMLEFVEALYDLSFGKWLPSRFLKYALVGASGVLVNQSGVWLAQNAFGMTVSNSLAFGIELSIITNFFLNNYWTFRHRKLVGAWTLARGLLTYNTICFAGAFINYAVGMQLSERFGMNLYLANLIGISLATLWNYMVNSQITWTSAKDAGV